jgi:hypothetical protein
MVDKSLAPRNCTLTVEHCITLLPHVKFMAGGHFALITAAHIPVLERKNKRLDNCNQFSKINSKILVLVQ